MFLGPRLADKVPGVGQWGEVPVEMRSDMKGALEVAKEPRRASRLPKAGGVLYPHENNAPRIVYPPPP
jgi:hypothetical protein